MALSARFHPAAEAQLFELYAYIAADAGRARAGAFIGRLRASCLGLGDFPEMGRSASELGEGHRQHPIERRAVIVYVVLAEHVENPRHLLWRARPVRATRPRRLTFPDSAQMVLAKDCPDVLGGTDRRPWRRRRTGRPRAFRSRWRHRARRRPRGRHSDLAHIRAGTGGDHALNGFSLIGHQGNGLEMARRRKNIIVGFGWNM